MNAGIVQDDDNPDDEDGIADNLCNRMLQGAIEAASDQKAIKKVMFCARWEPKNRDEERD